DQYMPHARDNRDLRRRLRNFWSANRRRHVFTVEKHLLSSVQSLQIDARPARKRLKLTVAIERKPSAHRLQRQCPVHRARIDVEIAHQLRHATRQRALPRTDWSID